MFLGVPGRSKVLQLVQTEEVHIRLTAGVSESACDLKKAYPEGATEDLLQEEEEDSSQSQEGGAIRASRRTDWKDELRDIQAARVEREVARFQRTIDETQRRWEENYARAAPRSAPATGHSDSSTEGLHNPRPAAYLVPPRHDLWRTVSVDTLGEPARDRTTLQPLLRHTSVDNLRPSTKVSNLSPLGPNPRQNSMNTVSSLSNINLSNNCGGSKAAPSYQPQPAHGQSVESMSGYSDGESHGDGNDSDVSTSTPDKVPVLPSVRKLASKFDVASRERVNDLDKHGKDGSLAFNGKKNIFIEKSSPTDPPYIRNLTNNLNKRTEKTYNVKEVRSLPNRSNTTHDPQPASDTDTYFTDHDDSEFDDQATVTSVSLPPTPHSLNGGLSYSTSSLLDSDSCYSLDSRDQNQASPGEEAAKTIFGVTLRKVSSSSGSRSSVSSNSLRTNDESTWHNSHYDRQNSYSSSVDLHHERTPISETDSDSDAPNALRQVTIIKIDDKTKHEYQSMTDLSLKYPKEHDNQRRYSSTLNLALESEFAGANQPVRKTSLQALPPLQPLSANSRQKSMPNLAAMPSIAFAPKGRKRSMRDFLKSYQRQTSLSEINRIEEKVEEEWNNQRNGHVPLQRMTSAPAWNHNSFHEEQNLSQSRDIQPVQEAVAKHETSSPVLETEQTQRTNDIESPPPVACQNSLPPTNHSSKIEYPSYEEEIGQGVKNVQHESDDESSMSDSTVTSDTPEQDDTKKAPMKRAKSVSDLLKLYTDMETKAGRPPSRISKKELFGSQDLLRKKTIQQSHEEELIQREFVQSREQVRGKMTQGTSLEEKFSPNAFLEDQRVENSVEYVGTAPDLSKTYMQEQVQSEPNQDTSTNEVPSPRFVLDDGKVKDFLEYIEGGSYTSTPDSAKEPNTTEGTTEMDTHKKPLVKAKSISDLLKLYSDKQSNGEETPLRQPTEDSKVKANKTIITLSDNEQYPKIQSTSAKVISVEEPVSVHRSRGLENIPLKPSVISSKASSYDQPDSKTPKLQHDLRRSPKTNAKNTGTITSGSVPSEKPVLSQNTKPFGKTSRSNEKMNDNVTNKDRNGNSIYEGEDNRTVISVSDNSPHSLFHASIINIDSEDSGYSPVKYPSYNDAHHYPPLEDENTGKGYYSTSNPEVKYSQVIPIEMDNHSSQNRPKMISEDTNDYPVQVIEAESKGPHVTVISLTEAPSSVPPPVLPPAPPSSDESSEEEAMCDPRSLTKMIVHGSRCGSSTNRRPGQRKKSITAASVPLNSPFSPVRRKASLSPDGTVISPTAVTTSPTFTDAPLLKTKLGPQYSFDEGVDLTLSDADLAQSAVSTESKSTSSVDTIGKDSPEPRVLCD